MASKKPMVEAAAPPPDKQKALETCMAQIERTYGKGPSCVWGRTPYRGGGHPHRLPLPGPGAGHRRRAQGPHRGDLRAGVLGQDHPGPAHRGGAQKRGGEVAFIDAEHALDPGYARALGVDIDSMLISQPDTGEQGLEICEALVRSGAIDVVVVDSVAALTPRAEIEGDMATPMWACWPG